MIRQSLALLLLVFDAMPPSAPGAEGVPDLTGPARVTLPYSEVKALWEAARPDPGAGVALPAPPVEALVRSAEFRVVPGAGSTRVEARFGVRSLVDGWRMVPLVGGDPRLVSAELPGEGSPEVVHRDGCYQARSPPSWSS